jgi:uncharacterized membrane protein
LAQISERSHHALRNVFRLMEDGMAKTAAFGTVHLCTAFGVSYALSGSVTVAGAVTVVEPVVNMVAHYFFDKAWDRHFAHAPAPRAAALEP